MLLAGLSAAWGGVLGVRWAMRSLTARIELSDQRVRVAIPEPVEVSADLTGKVDVALDTLVATEVPVDQHFQIPLDQTVSAQATIDHDVPVKVNVHVKQTVPVNTVVDVDTMVHTRVLGQPVAVPMQAKIPLRVQVPLDVVIPVDQMVPLRFTVPVTARIKQTFDVPLKVRVAARVPVKTRVDIPVISGLKARVHIADEPLALVKSARVDIPLDDVKLLRRTPGGDSEPLRRGEGAGPGVGVDGG